MASTAGEGSAGEGTTAGEGTAGEGTAGEGTAGEGTAGEGTAEHTGEQGAAASCGPLGFAQLLQLCLNLRRKNIGRISTR